jgi:hypothetical protein
LIKNVEVRERWTKEFDGLAEAALELAEVARKFREVGWQAKDPFIRRRQNRLGGGPEVWAVDVEFVTKHPMDVPA